MTNKNWVIQMEQSQSTAESRGVFRKRRKFALVTRPAAQIEVRPDGPTFVKAKHALALESYPETKTKDFRFLCNACGTKLKASESISGKRADCPNCGHTISIPLLSAEPQTGHQWERGIPYETPKTIKFFCIRCGQSLESERLMAKARFACPSCKNAMIVPRPADE